MRLYESGVVPIPHDLVAMDLEWDLLTTAWVAGKNCFFVAEPGVAKTMLGRIFAEVTGTSFFRKQMHAFTPPERIFGHDNIPKMLKDGIHEMITTGYLPEAQFALLDELFKTGKPCLDPLLTYLNEGVYEAPHPMKGETRCVFSASNEIPTGKAAVDTEAFWDRLHIRHQLVRIRGSLVVEIMRRANERDTRGGGFQIQPRDWTKEIDARRDVVVPDLVFECANNMQSKIEAKGMVVSNRRMCDLIHVVKAVAIINGRTTADVKDLRIARWMFWNQLDEIPAVAEAVESMLDPVGAEIEKNFNAALQVQNEAREQEFDENDAEQLKAKRRFYSAKNKALKGIRQKLQETFKLSGDPRVKDAIDRMAEIQREFTEFLIADIEGDGDV